MTGTSFFFVMILFLTWLAMDANAVGISLLHLIVLVHFNERNRVERPEETKKKKKKKKKTGLQCIHWILL